MRNNKIYNKIKWSLVSVAVWTMSFSPAAMGQQPSAYNYTVEQLQDNIKTLGLNKRMTLGQFFEKNKHLMPERVRREVETAISDSRNVLMPDFEVVSAKTTTGEVIPTIRISNDRELVNLQWFGEKNKVVKYGAANISEVDIANFNDMFARVLATDANLRKQYEPKQISRMQTGFKYPDVTRAEWKTMSLQAKVSYIQDLRAVWESANAVLAYKNKSKPKNGALFNFQQKNNLFFELFLGQDAVARTAAARSARTARVSSASSCLVAGYMSEYVNGVCSVERAKAGFANDELTRSANEACNTRQAGQIACNPFIYGTPNGEPRCITPSRTDADFQRATHFDGPCERDNHLQSAPEALDLLNDPAKRAGRYAPENLKKSISDLEAEQAAVPANIELSKNYILGVLKFRGTTVADFNTATFSEANLEQIMQIRDKFKVDIERARSACSEVANAPGAVERNYLQACDQLHRRFLFVDAALATRCQGGGLTYRADTMKCACTIAAAPAPASPAPASPAPAAPAPAASPAPPVASTPAPPAGEVLVPPGARCPAAAPAAAASTTPPPPPPVPPVPPAPPAAPVASSAVTCDESGSNPDCVCPSGARPRVAASDSTGAVALASSPCAAASTTADPAARSCNFLCKIGRGIGSVFKFAVNNAPILLAAGVSIYLITKLAPKKPALAAPADKCPNGSIAPCVQQCTGSLVMLPTGSCGCPACVLGQTSNSACECVSSGTNTPTTGTKLCGDGTYVNVTTPCPTYACWNGSSYENPTQCPSQVPAAESTRVRSGN